MGIVVGLQRVCYGDKDMDVTGLVFRWLCEPGVG